MPSLLRVVLITHRAGRRAIGGEPGERMRILGLHASWAELALPLRTVLPACGVRAVRGEHRPRLLYRLARVVEDRLPI